VATTILSPQDFNKNEIQNARVQNLGSAPGTPVTGQIWYDSVANLFKYWNGTAHIAAPRLDQIPAPTASVSMGSQLITNVLNPVGAQDAATRGYVLGLKVTDLTAPTTAVAFNSQQLTGVADPSAAQHAATQNYVLTRKVTDLTSPTASFSMNSQKIVSLLDPTAAQDAATQNFVLTRKVTDLTAPTAAFSMNSQKITSLGTPTVSTDAATMAYVDTQVESARQGISYKMPVRAAATTNVTVSAPGTSIGGVTTGWTNGHRVLLTNQTTGSENGIYVWVASGSPMTRALDADVFGEVQDGTQVYVAEGTDAEKVYRQTATITSFTGQTWGIAASGGTYIAGAGMTESAGTFNVIGGTGITVAADLVSIDTAVVVRKWTDLIGDGTTTAIVNTHNLGTRAVQVTVRRATTPWDEVIVDNAATTTNTVTTTFATAPTTDQFEIVISG
jgi:hypothetical protein